MFFYGCPAVMFECFVVCAVTCENATAKAFQRVSIKCTASGLTSGVNIGVEWLRDKTHVEEDENHLMEVDTWTGILTILEVGEYL